MKRLIYLSASAVLMFGGTTASAEKITPPTFDFSKHVLKAKNSRSAFASERMKNINATNEVMFGKQAPRFAKQGKANEDGTFTPDFVFDNKEMMGDIDGPNGELWFYDGEVQYEKVVHNEYYTELIPVSFSINIYDGDMKLRTTISDIFELKEDEARVRQVDVLPIITKNYFNSDDKLEVAITILVNPEPFGLRPYTYVYSIGNEKDAEGNDVPVRVVNGMVNDVLDASDENGENVLMTFLSEGNNSGLSEEEALDPDNTENYWKYQLGHFVHLSVYGKADAEGNFTKVFDKEIIYYQAQGNQQDDPVAMTMLRDGKAVIAFPYYEKVFYNPFYSFYDDMTAAEDNNLVIELWEQPAAGEQFQLAQTTKLPVVKAGDEDVLWSYYGIGAFNWTKDVSFDGDQASFVVTRRDYVVSSDSERKSYFAYNPDGTVKKTLFENSVSHSNLSDLKGFDPMVVFASAEGDGFMFHFMNLRTFETELDLNYDVKASEYDEPDYIMANMDRTLSPDGKDFFYVAEMRMPEYDDINDVTYMRVAWINREGKVDHIDKVNMGNNINYAQLYVNDITLDPHFFTKDDNQEYMLLIKRAINDPEHPDGVGSTEQLLVAQKVTPELPEGKDIMMLGECEYGAISNISPVPGTSKNRLCVTYIRSLEDTQRVLTVVYYDLPLDEEQGGGEDPWEGVEGIGAEDAGFTFDGFTVNAPASDIEVYSMQGLRVAAGHDSLDLSGLENGVYVVRAAGKTAKIAIR